MDKTIFLIVALVTFGINLATIAISVKEAGWEPKKLLSTFKKFPFMKPIGLVGVGSLIIYLYLLLA